jgi:PAS domain S-box-containing protein
MTLTAVAFACFFRRQLQREKQIELQLKYSHENLDFALQSGRMGTWDIQLEDDSIICSKEMLEIWGVTTKEFSYKRGILQSKVHHEDLPKMNDAINSAIAGLGVYEMEFRIFPKPGQMRWVLSRGRCAFAPGLHKPTRFSGVVFDITESKDREAALREAVRARDQFLTIAGHELKTPLTNLHMQIQLRQRDLQRGNQAAFASERTALFLQKQLNYVRRLNQLVDNLLDVQQISEGRLKLSYEYFDVCKLLQDVVARLQETTEDVKIELKLNSEQAMYGNWDWFRLEQILLNLLENALKYGGGDKIEVSLKTEENGICISIRDFGKGVPQKDQTRIFQRFERAISENEVSGMGLGLYISQTIARLHGGEIRLTSSEGQGAEFAVFLPLQKEVLI